MHEKERGKFDSCLAGLRGVTSTLRAVVDYGLEQLRASAVKPRVTPWVDAFLSMNHHINEVNDVSRVRSPVQKITKTHF